MPKVVYTAAKGLVQQKGSGFEINSDSLVLSALPTSTVQAKTSNPTITAPGVYTLSGTVASVITGTMPLASDVPGGIFIFRNLSATGNYLTGSAETSGTKVFKGVVTGSEAQTQGSKLTLYSGVGASVALVSDGKSFLVMASSGSLTIGE